MFYIRKLKDNKNDRVKDERENQAIRSEITIYTKACKAEEKRSKATSRIIRQQPLPWLHPEARLFVRAADSISAARADLC